MPKFSCRCKTVINLSSGTSEAERYLILNSQIEQLGDRLDKGEPTNYDEFHELLLKNAIDVIACPNCKRLHLNRGNGIYDSYSLEYLVESTDKDKLE